MSSLVQHNLSAFQATQAVSATFASPNTAGNLLVAVSYDRLHDSGTQTIVDTAGNTWVLLVNYVDAGANSITIWYAANCVGGVASKVTVTMPVAGSYNHDLHILEISGVNTLRSLAATATGNGTALTTNSLAVITGDFAVACFSSTTGGLSVTAPFNVGQLETFCATGTNAPSTGTISAAATAGSGFWSAILVDFKQINSISGNAGVAGATVSYTGTSSGSVIADGSGNYTISNLSAGSYTITPSKTGYSFSPASRNETVAGSDITGVDFTATQIVVATPTFSPIAGTYSSAQTVTVSDTDSGLAGFAMYYTTDGSTPTTGSTLYSGPITVSTSQTIKVLAVATGYANSIVGSAAYVISIPPTVYSVPDCRNYATFPNNSVTIQGTKQYTVPAHPSRTPPVDSRVNKPVDSRKSPNIPQNSRTNPPFES